MRYMQETANRQCESSGLPLDKLRDENGLGFILGTISLKIHTPLYAYEDFEVRTWCKPARGFTFNRYFEIVRGEALIAEAATVWVLIDVNEKKLVRAEAHSWMDDRFFYDEPIDPNSLPKKPRLSKETYMQEVGSRKISYSDIDYNMHMNNTRYPDMICDYIDEMTEISPAYRVGAMSLSYIKESPLGANLKVLRSNTDNNTLYVRTQNEQGDTCLDALVELETI